MRIQVFSDVHTEFHKDGGKEFLRNLDPKGVDVLVVPGDLCAFENIEAILLLLSMQYPHVVYTFGNHEAYGASIEQARQKAKAAARGTIHFLDNSTCEIDGQRFVGTTLWFPRDSKSMFYERQMNDFSLIRFFRETVYEENDRAVEFLTKTVKTDDVVVTHYLPSQACVAERFKTSPLNRFFVCDMDDLIFDAKPKLWVHGHTHDSVDIVHGSTRIVCNPFGYAGVELNLEYVDQKIIEL